MCEAKKGTEKVAIIQLFGRKQQEDEVLPLEMNLHQTIEVDPHSVRKWVLKQ